MRTKISIYNKVGFNEDSAKNQSIKPLITKEFDTVKKAKAYIRKTYPNNKLQPSHNIGKYIEYNEKVIGILESDVEIKTPVKIEPKKQPTTTAVATINKIIKPATITKVKK